MPPQESNGSRSATANPDSDLTEAFNWSWTCVCRVTWLKRTCEIPLLDFWIARYEIKLLAEAIAAARRAIAPVEAELSTVFDDPVEADDFAGVTASSAHLAGIRMAEKAWTEIWMASMAEGATPATGPTGPGLFVPAINGAAAVKYWNNAVSSILEFPVFDEDWVMSKIQKESNRAKFARRAVAGGRDSIDESEVARPNGPGTVGEFWWRGNRHSGLQTKPWRLLAFLWKQNSQSATIDDALESVWDGQRKSENIVHKNVELIRRWIGHRKLPLVIFIENGCLQILQSQF